VKICLSPPNHALLSPLPPAFDHKKDIISFRVDIKLKLILGRVGVGKVLLNMIIQFEPSLILLRETPYQCEASRFRFKFNTV